MQNIRGSHNGAVPSLRESNVVVGDVRISQKKARLLVRSPSAFSMGKSRKAFLSQRVPLTTCSTGGLCTLGELKTVIFWPEVWFSTGNQAWKAVGFLVRETPICYQRPRRFSSEGDPGITSPLQHGFVCSKGNAPALMCLSLALP
jgi:hypothetical protein